MTNSILKFWQALESSDPFDPLFEAAPVLMHAIDSSGTLVKVSQFWAAKLGYTIDEMVGHKAIEFLSEASQKHAIEVAQPQILKSGKVYNVEYDFIRKNGKVLPVLLSALSEYDREGNHVRSLAVIFDNSEAKRAAAELHQKQRMEAIGGLVGGVAHDFNNLLAVIQGNLEFLKQDPDSPDRHEFIDYALDATQKGGRLTQQLLSYGRMARLSPTHIDLNEVVRKTDRMIRRLVPANIELETVTSAGLWHIRADAAQLETAILNIINNAKDTLPQGGRITMETANIRISDDYVDARDEEIQPGRYVMLAISDTGMGMEAAVLDHIFDPFFTTKPVGKGSGLGLSMVFGFMRQSKGTIRAYSEPGVGSSFRLYFPAEVDAAQDRPVEPQEQPHDGRGKVVLLAEDEPAVRSMIERQLQQYNFKVIACPTGDAAYHQLQTGLRPDLLLTDIVMPGSLQGPELARAARVLMPDLRVLYISGYPTEAAIHGNGVRPQDRQLIKPVSLTDLAKALRELIS